MRTEGNRAGGAGGFVADSHINNTRFTPESQTGNPDQVSFAEALFRDLHFGNSRLLCVSDHKFC